MPLRCPPLLVIANRIRERFLRYFNVVSIDISSATTSTALGILAITGSVSCLGSIWKLKLGSGLLMSCQGFHTRPNNRKPPRHSYEISLTCREGSNSVAAISERKSATTKSIVSLISFNNNAHPLDSARLMM